MNILKNQIENSTGLYFYCIFKSYTPKLLFFPDKSNDAGTLFFCHILLP